MFAILASHLVFAATSVPQVSTPWIAFTADKGQESSVRIAEAEFAKIEKNLLYILSDKPPTKTVAIHLVKGNSKPVISRGEITAGLNFGGFPKQRYRMDVELASLAIDLTYGHETEPLWGPALGDFIAIEAVKRSGHDDEAFYDIRTRYRKALKADPTFRKVNLAGNVPDDVRRAKGLWMIWQFQVRYPPDFLRQYMRLRKKFIAKTPDDVDAIVSSCVGNDQSLWFKFYGTFVDVKRSILKF